MPQIRPTTPADAERSSWTYGLLLEWHLRQGTKPELAPGKMGTAWAPQKFAYAVGATDRTLRNWINNRNPPRNPGSIEQVLFGNEAHHEEARLELRAAFDRTWLTRFAPANSPPADPAAVAAAPVHDFRGEPAIAVLPLVNQSVDLDQEYFADAITDEIIVGLTACRWFPVLSRNSTFVYKGKPVSTRTVAEELGARYVISGGVQKANDKVRIRLELTDTASGKVIWSGSLNGTINRVFEFQDEITGQIVSHVFPALSRAEEHRAFHHKPTELSAWDLMHRGLWYHHKFTKEDNAEARKLLLRATRADPNYALPQAWLAATHLWDLVLFWSIDPAQSLFAAREAAETAVRLDGEEAGAHAVLAVCLTHLREPNKAIEEGELAVTLNPSLAHAHNALGWAMIFGGYAHEAVHEIEAARRLSPKDPFLAHFHSVQALAHLLAREPDEAVLWADRAVRADSTNIRAYHRLTCALAHTGNLDTARETLRLSLALGPPLTLKAIDASYPFVNADDREYFLSGLREAGWSE